MAALPSMQSSWILVATALGCLAAYKLLTAGRRPVGYPPGPPTLPVLGNLHQISAEKTHVQFQGWARQYGPIFSLMLGAQTVVVLSSDQVVKDLLDKRSAVYSSRADSYIINMATRGLNLVMMPYNATWRMGHKILSSSLNPHAVRDYLPCQDLESKQLLVDLLEDSTIFAAHIRRYASSLTTQIVFGFRTIHLTDPRLLQLYVEFGSWVQLTKNAFVAVLDFFPSLRCLPKSVLPLKRVARELYDSEHSLFMQHWQKASARPARKTQRRCIAETVREAQKKEGFSDDFASHLCGIVLEAGTDTQATELIAFVQAMVLFHEVQKAAQQAIDEVCGERMPTFEDRGQLRYVRACARETLRWMPSTLMGIPHATTAEDHYMGYRIPKGALVIMNTWAIHMDSKRHPDPRRFDPMRFLDDDRSFRAAALSPKAADRDQFIFGAGRRLCPGIDVAENTLFIVISRLLWAFDIRPALDADGREDMPDADDIVSGLPAHPRPFRARITARTAERAERVRAEWDEAKTRLDGGLQWPSSPSDP